MFAGVFQWSPGAPGWEILVYGIKDIIFAEEWNQAPQRGISFFPLAKEP
jgi:hypothetical protein